MGIYLMPLNCTLKTGYFPGHPVVKNLPVIAGDTGLVPGLRVLHMPWGN